MNINVEMTEQEFDSFRQWRGKLDELNANKIYDSLTAIIVRHVPRDNAFGEFGRLKNLSDELHGALREWGLCQKKV